MPRRQAITDPSLRYKRYLVEFMSWFHERPHPYPTDTVFEQDVLLTVKPDDIRRWMSVKIFGLPEPTVNDHPTLGRASSLSFYKKSLSFFMPNKLMTWNEVSHQGNPTKSQQVNSLIKRVLKEQVRKTGKASSARRAIVHGEFQNSLTILERPENDNIRRFLVPCIIKMQYNMVARLDDVCELEMEDLKPNEQFTFSLMVKMCWSKNIHEERDAPEQILLGAMDRRYCILLALAVYLEVWIGSGQGMVGSLIFNTSEDDPVRSKKSVAEILRLEVFNNPNFVRMKPGPLGTHSLRKLPSTHSRRSGCSRDDVDCRGRWRRKKRVADDYIDVCLPYPDAKVAGKLCIGGPVKYVLRLNSGISDDWILEHVVPNIMRRFPRQVGLVLGRALLWACFEQGAAGTLPAMIFDRVHHAYGLIRQFAVGENPVIKVPLIIAGDEDELTIDKIRGVVANDGEENNNNNPP
jgi:hypothetical protein